MSRYNGQKILHNSQEQFEEQFERRDVKKIDHYAIKRLSYPSRKDDEEISYYRYIWKPQDKFYRLAAEFYNDPTLWWVIAQYNQTPTEQHLKEGQIIKIPFPLGRILKIME